MTSTDTKTILVDIGHPGHVHLFRNAILAWKAAGHHVVVSIRDRGLVSPLLTGYGIEHSVASQVKTSFLGLVYELLEHDWGVVSLALRHKVDVMVGTSVCIAHAGVLLGKPAIIFNEDDKHYLLAWALLAYPFASAIVTPFVLSDRKTPRYITHRSLHELAYLHPDHFTPDPGVLDELGVTSGERFFIVRFVALHAHHDFNHRGLDVGQRRRLLRFLEQFGRVFVSDEALPEEDCSSYRLPIHPSRIHHAMYFSTLLVGDSQTMAVEAAVLGTTAVRCNTFVRECSIINELEERYGLIHSYHPHEFDRLLADIERLLAQHDLHERCSHQRQQLLRDKGNFARTIERLVLQYDVAHVRGKKVSGRDAEGATNVDIGLKLLQWMVQRGFRGLDPYLLDEKLNALAGKGWLRPSMRKVRSMLKPFHSLIPKYAFTMATPVLMPKVLGLSLSGIAGLSTQLELGAYQACIDNIISLLLSHRSKKSRNLAWGHPFSWGATIRYEPDTPSIPVTGLIAHGLMDILEANRTQGLREELESIANYIVEENGAKDFGDSLCFYYAPDNADLCYNTSILAASFLFRLVALTGNAAWRDVALKALRFVLQGQNADGSWYYTDPRGDTPLDKTIDGRHSGFILEHLRRIADHVPPGTELGDQLRYGLTRGTCYYLTTMMDGVIPRWEPSKTFPVDIKDVAQAIITLSVLGDTIRARQCLQFAYDQFFDGTDAFWYKLQQNGQVNKTVFIRWSQAWMLKAIGALVLAEARQ
jgi:predicted glycosyltransferase